MHQRHRRLGVQLGQTTVNEGGAFGSGHAEFFGCEATRERNPKTVAGAKLRLPQIPKFRFSRSENLP
jgi:hypothetical protein